MAYSILHPVMYKKIYDKRENCSPLLEKVILGLQYCLFYNQQLLQNPQRIIEDIINRFDCIHHIRDNFNRLSIDVAVEEGLELREGMQHVVKAMEAKQQCPIIHMAAQYGLSCSNCMKELLVDSN